jgi:DNA-binding NtrC family response regulator
METKRRWSVRGVGDLTAFLALGLDMRLGERSVITEVMILFIFRLAVIPIHLQPLRERREDIVPLARHFLAKWNKELGRKIVGWTARVDTYLRQSAWPGNVRELENTIERGVVLARGDHIDVEDLLIDMSTESVLPEKAGMV